MQINKESFLRRHPIISIVLIMIGISFITSIISSSRVRPPVPIANIKSLEVELSKWEEGRWDGVYVNQNEDNSLTVIVHASPEANDMALNGYCKIMKEAVVNNVPSEYPVNLFIYKSGKTAKVCY